MHGASIIAERPLGDRCVLNWDAFLKCGVKLHFFYIVTYRRFVISCAPWAGRVVCGAVGVIF